MSAERSGPAICNVSNIGEGKDEMTKASIDLQDLRRRLYVKEKAEPSGGSEDLLRNERASAGNDGIGGGCTTLEDCLTPIECDATGRKSPQQDRSHKRWREANGGAPKASRCFYFFLPDPNVGCQHAAPPFWLGAAAIVLTFSFLGFLDSRFPFCSPLAMPFSTS